MVVDTCMSLVINSRNDKSEFWMQITGKSISYVSVISVDMGFCWLFGLALDVALDQMSSWVPEIFVLFLKINALFIRNYISDFMKCLTTYFLPRKQIFKIAWKTGKHRIFCILILHLNSFQQFIINLNKEKNTNLIINWIGPTCTL